MSYLLAVDPGADMGVAIFDMRTGELVEATTINLNPKDTYGRRLQMLIKTYRSLFDSYLPETSALAWERVPPTSQEILRFYVGAIIAIHPHVDVNAKRDAISPSTWKKYVRDASDCPIADPKGETALDIVLPGVAEDMMLDHNACDAVIIGLAALARRKKK